MADVLFNRGKGRGVQMAENINGNSPANSAFIWAALGSVVADATLIDLDDMAAVEANGSTAEATNSGYARKVLTDASSITITYDDTNDRVDVDCPDQTWTAVAASPGAWVALVLLYDSDTTGGTDANLLPVAKYDFAVTPDGSDITAQIGASGFLRAT